MGGKTPDRFPGESEDEGILLDPADSDPTQEGGIRLVSGAFRMRDASGVFNPRSGGGGITPSEHLALDENYFEEYTYSGGKVTNATVWETSGKLKKIREEQYTYAGSRVSQVVTIQYDAAGTEVERLTETYTYTGSRVDSVTAVRSVP